MTQTTPTIDNCAMKKELRQLARNIDTELYARLLSFMSIPQSVLDKFKTAEIYFVNQLVNNELIPWEVAKWLKSFGNTTLAAEFETFAVKFNFPQDPTMIDPQLAIMQLLRHLRSALTQDELLCAMRDSNSETFEAIFREIFESGRITPSLAELKCFFQDEDREDLAATVDSYSVIISKMNTDRFSQTITLCLDALDIDIFSLLTVLREAHSKEYFTSRNLSMHNRTFSLCTDFIPLTFPKDVDTSNDVELKTLMGNDSKQDKNKETRYFNALMEIYSSNLNGSLISLIGHPGTGKTFYCKKLVNEFINGNNEYYRFVLLIACKNLVWHTLEEQYITSPGKKSKMLELFLQIIIPSFRNSKEIVRLILNTEGDGMLLVIDSYDEFPQKFNFSATLLYSILKRQVLTKSTILITSRPGAWNQLIRGYGSDLLFDHSWQLLEFSDSQRNQFITTTLTPLEVFRCHTFLQHSPELNILNLVPANINLLTGLVDSAVLLANVRTLTYMYLNLVLFTLDKELKRIDKQAPTINSLNNLPADMKSQFNRLAELAYQGLIKRLIILSPEEFPCISTLSKKFAKSLGLFRIITVMTTQLTTIDNLSCPHLTLQEFLSAWHLSQKSPREIFSIIKQIFVEDTWPAMKVCVRFLCGILSQGHDTIISIITDNLHRTSAHLADCNYLLFYKEYSTNYIALNYENTDTHLSILPYVLETQQQSIIKSYYKLLCPTNTNVRHFYLIDTIAPVDIYSITQFFTKLPPNCAISELATSTYLC